jgi:DNA-binding winged helix-turn-helix (wHTH) protein
MILETTGGTYTLERRQLQGFVTAARLDILVDTEREHAVIGDTVVGMEGREIPLKILASMVRRQGKPMALGQLFEDTWGRKYNPSFDSNTVYFHMCRLRKILDEASAGLRGIVIKVTGGYRLKPGLRMGTAKRATAPRAEYRSRDSVVEVIRQRGFINNRSYCEITNASRSTALRELADLVRLGVLERVGQGRSARYRLAEASRVAA